MPSPILITAPTGSDAAAVSRVLEMMRLQAECLSDIQALASATNADSTPLLIIAEEALAAGVDGLNDVLIGQAAWSDLPILLLAVGDRGRGHSKRWSLFEQLGNVTILERPLQVGVLQAAVRSALRARHRQFLARGTLLELERSRHSLEDQMEERTALLRREVEERQKVEAALAHAQRLDAIGKLTGGVAHDFNNLLQVIVGGLEVIGRHPAGSVRHDAIMGGMRQAADRGAKLTQQLLAFARRQPLSPARTDVGSQIANMEELLRRSLRRGVELRMRIAPDIWPVAVDPTQLEVAVLNLVVNARDAIVGDGLITVSADNYASYGESAVDGIEGDMVRITVRDTGAGMSEEVKQRAVEPFFTTKDAGRGTGLGLSQVHGFAHQSNGTLHIETKEGKGTALCLFLPRAIEPEYPSSQPPAAPSNGKAGGLILVVEDEPRVAEFACEMLRALGYECEHAATADEALRHDLSRFNLVLSDVIMPGSMDGAELAREIRKRMPDLPVVLATGFASPESLDGIGVPIIGKPYRQAELGEVVAMALATRRVQN